MEEYYAVTKIRKIIAILILLFLSTGCIARTESIKESVGGETDEHGCMLMAGYTWCEAKQKCLRTWEEFCESEYASPAQGQAIELARAYVMNTTPYKEENGRNLEVIKILQVRCPGCWYVELQYDLGYTNDRVAVNITIVSWNVVSVVSGRGGVAVLTPELKD